MRLVHVDSQMLETKRNDRLVNLQAGIPLHHYCDLDWKLLVVSEQTSHRLSRGSCFWADHHT
jgi:hypothetical protein